jgi:hypothetical protein
MADAIFTIPKAQALRFININERSKVQNYDNTFAERLRYAETSPYHYTQKFQKTDTLWVQFRTNYTTVNAYLVDKNNTRINKTGDLIILFTDSSGRSYYNLPIDLTIIEGCYFIEFTGSDIDKSTFTFQSEIFDVVTEVKDSILIEWFGNDAYDDMMHWDGINQSIRVVGRDRNLSPEQSKSIYENTDYAPITLKSKPIRLLQVDINIVPYWVIEKINIALSHDKFYIQNVQYNSEDIIESEVKGDSQMYSATITLTQLNFEDGEDKQITGGVILQSFLKINDTDYLLINDSGDRLKIN